MSGCTINPVKHVREAAIGSQESLRVGHLLCHGNPTVESSGWRCRDSPTELPPLSSL